VKPGILQTIYENEYDRYAAGILLKIVYSLWAAYIVVVGMAVYWGDFTLIAITLVGIIALLVPLWMLFRGRLRQGAFIVAVSVLVIVTSMAVEGQGINDIAIMAYPGIIVIGSLILQRRNFFILSALTMVALGGVIFGEAYGFFTPQPVSIPEPIDFIIVSVILIITILLVDSLAENMRRNIRQANQEITSRKTIELQLRHQNIHDALTGIFNRTFFEEALARMERLQEFPVSIIVADVDDLKVVNDKQGHAVGDELLRQVSTVLSAAFRSEDVWARIGGDEFAVLLPRTDSAMADQMLKRIRTALMEYNTKYPELPLQLSLGSSTVAQGKLVDAFRLADQRMYAEKAARKLK
jgi:diguanylate cyclase (GGDEF)-like protein